MTGQVTRREASRQLPAKAAVGTLVLDTITKDVARWAARRNLAPVALSGFSLGFAIIAAGWLTDVSGPGAIISFFALLVSFVACGSARVYAGRVEATGQVSAKVDWAQGACALLAEIAVYAGIAVGAARSATAAGGAGMTGPFGPALRATSVATLGGAGTSGVWMLAIVAAVLLAVREMANLGVAAAKARTYMIEGPDAARRILVPAPPSGIRLVFLAVAVYMAGARAGFLLALVIGGLALLARFGVTGRNSGVIGYRGDGPLSVWMGGFVDGRLPPAPPIFVGLLVIAVMTAFGMNDLGLIAFAPAVAMLVAALGCWHPHDGPRDWLVPPLLQAGEYVFLVALGFGAHVQPPITFALVTAVALRHFDLAYRTRNQVSPSWFIRQMAFRPPRFPGADWRGLGWEGRMLVAAVAAAAGIVPYAYPVFAVYLWLLLAREALTGWAAMPNADAAA
jgi:hypothetical protein